MSLAAGRTAALILLAPLILIPFVEEAQAQTRRFKIDYQVTVEAPTFAAELDVWVPLPTTSATQLVGNLKIEAGGEPRLTVEAANKNGVMYLKSFGPFDAPVQASASYTIERFEQKGQYAPLPDLRYLQPNRYARIDGAVADVTARAIRGYDNELSKARAIYTYVTGELRHDTSIGGWGQGNAQRACHVKAGDATDFNGLFVAMARSAGIPARFHVGHVVPPGQSSGTLDGPYAWAEFYIGNMGWIPADAFAGRKRAGKRPFFFGALDANRFELSSGRDIQLAPPQSGELLNFFGRAYAEADGEPLTNPEAVEVVVTFTELEPAVPLAP